MKKEAGREETLKSRFAYLLWHHLRDAFKSNPINTKNDNTVIDSLYNIVWNDVAANRFSDLKYYITRSVSNIAKQEGHSVNLDSFLKSYLEKAYNRLVRELINNAPPPRLSETEAKERIRMALDYIGPNASQRSQLIQGREPVYFLTNTVFDAPSLREALTDYVFGSLLALFEEGGMKDKFLKGRYASLVVVASILMEIKNMVKKGSFSAEAPDISIYDNNCKFTKTADTAVIMNIIGKLVSPARRGAFYEAVNLDKVSTALNILINDGKPALAKVVATHFVRMAQDAAQPAADDVNPNTGVGTIDVVEIGGKQINKKCLEEAIRSGKSYEDAVNSCAIGG